jgi:hypothetical protein
VPWHVLVLMEEAVVRGVGAFSAEEAKRRGIRWLDLARDAKTKEALTALVDGFARRAYVPESLKRFVTADEAENRWAALKQYARRRGHFLVTNGPYQLAKWVDGAVTLEVFRDFTNPMGVGGFDRFAIPRRAYVSRIVARGDLLEVSAEVERVEKFLREYRLVREPLPSGPAGSAPGTALAAGMALPQSPKSPFTPTSAEPGSAKGSESSVAEAGAGATPGSGVSSQRDLDSCR